MANKKENWFADWFDSEHYHKLYAHRDYSEAEKFIRNLFQFLQVEKQHTKVLDLACGKGRHALQVHQLGFNVIGLDLSPESIAHAKQYENDKLHFQTGDMRAIPFQAEFDLVLNLFTSFGYFQEEGENQQVIHSVAKALKPNGILVLDYLNVHHAESNLPSEEIIKRESTSFSVKKFIEGDFIVKDISIEENGEEHHHQEYVKRLDLKRFKDYLDQADLNLLHTFGDYQLNSFQEEQSDRLILVAQKKF